MPNLLKLLPSEILEKEDSRFIYNIFNPLLFEKKYESDLEIKKELSIFDYMSYANRGFNFREKKFVFPGNIADIKAYTESKGGKKQCKIISDLREFDDLLVKSDFFIFYFSKSEYNSIYKILKHYYNLVYDVDSYYILMMENKKLYVSENDYKKKKILKSNFNFYLEKYNTYKKDLDLFNIIFDVLDSSSDTSFEQIKKSISSAIASHLKIRTFDEDIVIEYSYLDIIFKNLDIYIPDTYTRFKTDAKKILTYESAECINVFDWFAFYTLDLIKLKTNYDSFKTSISKYDNNCIGFKKSSDMLIKNNTLEHIIIDLESDNLTFFYDAAEDNLEIYLYFKKPYRMYTEKLILVVNDEIIPSAIFDLNGQHLFGYTISSYFDDTYIYYKFSLPNIKKDPNKNFDISNIKLQFDMVDTFEYTFIDLNSRSLETNGFFDNFVFYSKNTATGFFEHLQIPININVEIIEKEDRFLRKYSFYSPDEESQIFFTNNEIVVQYFAFDYVYTPRIFVDYFNNMDNYVSIRFKTIMPYVLMEELYDNPITYEGYKPVKIAEPVLDYSSLTRLNGKMYYKNFVESNFMQIFNPYFEQNLKHSGRKNLDTFLNTSVYSYDQFLGLFKNYNFLNNRLYFRSNTYDITSDSFYATIRGKNVIIPFSNYYKNINNGIIYDITKHLFVVNNNEKCGYNIIENNNKYFLTDLNEYIELDVYEPIDYINFENRFFFDVFNEKISFVVGERLFNVLSGFVSTHTTVSKYNTSMLFIDDKTGILHMYDGATSAPISSVIDPESVDFDESKILINGIIFDIEESSVFEPKNRYFGMSINSLFYSGNILPDNNNTISFNRQNIFSSMDMLSDIYSIGHNFDLKNDYIGQELIAEELDIDIDKYTDFNMEVEQFIMFKNRTSSMKGLENYLKTSLKLISENLNISPVYLVQRNKYISEWAKVTNLNQNSNLVAEPLKRLVADLFETKLLNNIEDDLIDIFKNNEFELFSIQSNNIDNIIIDYIKKYITEEFLQESLDYYLIHNVWLKNNFDNILKYVYDQGGKFERNIVDSLTLDNDIDIEQLFYLFTKVSEQKIQTIETFTPIANFDDYRLHLDYNAVKFDKPYRYEILDISNFLERISNDIYRPSLLIRPLVEDGVFTKRDFRLLDYSIITESDSRVEDTFNEYSDKSPYKFEVEFDYLYNVLTVLNNLSAEYNYDFLSINLVIVKWLVEKYLNDVINSSEQLEREYIIDALKTEILEFEHPNDIILFNKIKENKYLRDFGSGVEEIYNSIKSSSDIVNSSITIQETELEEIIKKDKLKKPSEYFFDYLFFSERYDVIAKILALFTEDVIATSMIDLSLSIDIKKSQGDTTFGNYEKLIMSIFDEFIPFHTVIDKLIFVMHIIEGSNTSAISKAADVELIDNNKIIVLQKFIEKIKIYTDDKIYTLEMNDLFPSEGFKIVRGHDEFPHEFDRRVREASHSLFPMDLIGVDDEWYLVDDLYFKSRVADLYTPPAFAGSQIYSGLPSTRFEHITNINMDEYYNIKIDFFRNDNNIFSFFEDGISNIEIGNLFYDDLELELSDRYSLSIDTLFKIRFFDNTLLGHDYLGMDEFLEPSDLTSLVDLKEVFYSNIYQYFKDNLSVSLLDSIWTYTKFISKDIPGFDSFGHNELFHSRDIDDFREVIDVGVYEYLDISRIGEFLKTYADVSVLDDAVYTILDIKNLESNNIYFDEKIVSGIHIWAERSDLKYLNKHGVFLYPEYSNSLLVNNYDRLANLINVKLEDYIDSVHIDFGFRRILPYDPYDEMIKSGFYRINEHGSEIQKSEILDTLVLDISMYFKDVLGIYLNDMSFIGSVHHYDYKCYLENSEKDEEICFVEFQDRYNTMISHDFRDIIIAVDKYAYIYDPSILLNDTFYFNPDRDDFNLILFSDFFKSDIKMIYSDERRKLKINDYLVYRSIIDSDYADIYIHDHTKSKIDDYLILNMNFKETSRLVANEIIKQNALIMNSTDLYVSLGETIYYGFNKKIGSSMGDIKIEEKMFYFSENNIYYDSLDISIFEGNLTSSFDFKTKLVIADTVDINTGIFDNIQKVDTMSLYTNIADSKLVDNCGAFILTSVHDKSAVNIADSLSTYIQIKNEFIYNDFTNLLALDEVISHIDISNKDYGILTNISEKLIIAEDILLIDKIDLKTNESFYASSTFNDYITINGEEHIGITDVEYSDQFIKVNDYLKYGLKLKDYNMLMVSDKLVYGYSSIENDLGSINLNDILVLTRTYNDNISIIMNESLSYHEVVVYYDVFAVDINEIISTKIDLYVPDVMRVSISDNVYYGHNYNFKESSNISLKEYNFEYGFGKWFIEELNIFNKNFVYSSFEREHDNDIDITIRDKYTLNYNFKDRINITSYERMKFGPIFKEFVGISTYDGILETSLKLLIEKYGIDEYPHDILYGVEYKNDYSLLQSSEVLFSDTISNAAVEIFFKDSIEIYASSKLLLTGEGLFGSKSDILRNEFKDMMQYDVHFENIIWSDKEWSYFGELMHNLNSDYPNDGSNLSIISTGISDDLSYVLSFIFRESIGISTNEPLLDYFNNPEKIYDSSNIIFSENLSYGDYAVPASEQLFNAFDKERVSVYYELDDHNSNKIEYIYNNRYDLTINSNYYDAELIEEIFKYKFYDNLGIAIQSNVFETPLFSFSEFFSGLARDNIRLDLYKPSKSGSMAKTMTLISDNSKTNIHLFFNDVGNVLCDEVVHSLLASMPDEYF